MNETMRLAALKGMCRLSPFWTPLINPMKPKQGFYSDVDLPNRWIKEDQQELEAYIEPFRM